MIAKTPAAAHALRRLLLLLSLLAIPAAVRADAPRPAVKGGEAYRTAFQAIVDNKLDAARDALTKIEDPAERKAIAAWLDFVRCRFEPAAAAVKDALAANPRQPLALLLHARMSAAPEDAFAAAQSAVAEDPDNPVILWWSGEFCPPKQQPLREKWLEHLVEIGGPPDVPRGLDLARELLDSLRKLAGRETDRVVKGTRGELPIALRAGMGPAVSVALDDGRALQLTFDTGASALMLPKPTLSTLPHEVIGKATAYTVTGRTSVDRVLVDSFSVGALQYKSLMAVGSPHNALLGMSLFKHHTLVIDFANKRIVAHADRAEFEKEWAEQIRAAEAVDFVLLRNSILVPITVACGEKQTTGAILLDTGSGVTALSTRFAAAWNAEAAVPYDPGAARNIVGAAGRGQTQVGSMPNATISIGKWSLPSPRMPVIDLSATRNANGIDVSAILGIGEMSRRQFLIIDSPQRKLYIGPPQGR